MPEAPVHEQYTQHIMIAESFLPWRITDPTQPSSTNTSKAEFTPLSGNSSGSSQIQITPSHSSTATGKAKVSPRAERSSQQNPSESLARIISNSSSEQNIRDNPEKMSKKRRRYDAEELEKVNSVRQAAACIRCQKMKEPV